MDAPTCAAPSQSAKARASLNEEEREALGSLLDPAPVPDFLEDAAIREERVPNGRGEIVFYNLGKFSQLISDFETIHFHSKPAEKYGRLPTSFNTAPRTATPRAGRTTSTPTRTPCGS